ncbi:hypothetical protein WA026_020628 [Henosepilachna vigintioctopunctata]|uniref:Transmembrane protein 70 n=1 Tax=Henosepilachna vigintioctopunctata TaxID=420089 RepID=A0AAW1V5L9_9CUCU
MLLRICYSLLRDSHNLNHFSKFHTSTIILSSKKTRLNARIVATTNENYSSPYRKELPIRRVYQGLLTPQIHAVKIFSLSSSIVGIITQPFLYKEIPNIENVSMIIALYSCVGFFTLVTPLLLHMITKKYVTQLDYINEKDTYVASTLNFFCMTKKTEFKLEDVVVPDVPGMFTTLIAKRKALFLDPSMFKVPEHYERLMGYDKPMDFKLYESGTKVNNEDKNKS